MKKLAILLGVVLLISSCATREQLTFMNKGETKDSYPFYPAPEYRMQPDDNIYVEIKSTDPASSSFYNMKDEGSTTGAYNRAWVYLNSHSVSKKGILSLPFLGDFYVQGLTITEVIEMIEDELGEHLKNGSVFLKLISFNISVFGEVEKPGNFLIYDNQATVLDAIALAGGTTEYSRIRTVKVVRQLNDGSSKTIVMDLRREDSLESEGYFLQPRDKVYVEPTRGRPLDTNIRPFNIILASAGVIISAMALVVAINNNN